MKYLKTLHFCNIQAHKDTVLNLHPGLNIIKGTSHNGKSCLSRGFRWWLQNKPLAPQDKLKSWFAGKNEEMSVLGVFSDGGWVQRIHENGFNGYRVGRDEEMIEFEEYEALRGEVPPEVLEVLNLRSDLNFSAQHDGYFLFNKSSGEVAKLFNKSAGLDIIDSVLGKIDSMNRENNQDKEGVEKELLKEEEKLNTLLPIRNIEADIVELEKKTKREESLNTSLTKLETIAKNIEHLSSAIYTLRNKVMHREVVEQLLNSIEEWKKKDTEFSTINQISLSLKTMFKEVKEDREWLRIGEDKIEVEELLKTWEEENRRFQVVTISHEGIKSAERKILSAQTFLRSSVEQRKELESKLDFCDKCGAAKQYWTKEVV